MPSCSAADHFAEKVVRAKAAVARSDLSGARQLAEAAVNLQDKLPYMEPPYWYVPVDQALGAILLKSGSPREAAAAFKEACTKAPKYISKSIPREGSYLSAKLLGRQGRYWQRLFYPPGDPSCYS
jgi:hypothetical protein